jgi:hypothetical protein
MVFHQHVATRDATPAEALRSPLATLLSKLRATVDACADYYAAAALYEQLSKLSDAELARRGLSRATLARDVQAACDRRAAGL